MIEDRRPQAHSGREEAKCSTSISPGCARAAVPQGAPVGSSSSRSTLHASWQRQDLSQPKRTTCSPSARPRSPGWPQCAQCQAPRGCLPAPRRAMGKPRGGPGRLSPGWMGHSALQNAPFIESSRRIINKESKNHYLHFLAEEMKLQSQ